MSQPVDAPVAGLDAEARNRFIEEFAPRVRYIASRIASRLPSHVDLGDLISCGVIGLIDAIEKFDPSKNVKFETYAEFRIRGAILDELRNLDWVPRSVRQKAAQLEKAYEGLERRMGRPATEEEVAQTLNLSIEGVHDLIGEVNGVTVLSLDELRELGFQEDSDSAAIESLASEVNNPGRSLAFQQVRRVLADAIDALPEKEKLVLSLYYYEELTMKEIAQVLEITESRVSQIHTKAVLRLRGRLRALKD
ncbi:MAG: FliA/WhiG family RNA polymerase sigma factor [Candidatus Tectomicrobia bacterium]|nr:FliA/WhiG family RNA polymerase sigma factor [Candidatus Tectomicrobia bacterium]